MRKMLVAAVLILPLATPAMASAHMFPLDAFTGAIENITAARACDLITDSQVSDAMMDLSEVAFARVPSLPQSYQTAAMTAIQAGKDDASTPGFCDNFNTARLGLVRRMAADYDGGS